MSLTAFVTDDFHFVYDPITLFVPKISRPVVEFKSVRITGGTASVLSYVMALTFLTIYGPYMTVQP